VQACIFDIPERSGVFEYILRLLAYVSSPVSALPWPVDGAGSGESFRSQCRDFRASIHMYAGRTGAQISPCALFLSFLLTFAVLRSCRIHIRVIPLVIHSKSKSQVTVHTHIHRRYRIRPHCGTTTYHRSPRFTCHNKNPTSKYPSLCPVSASPRDTTHSYHSRASRRLTINTLRKKNVTQQIHTASSLKKAVTYSEIPTATAHYGDYPVSSLTRISSRTRT
jgi:hypothetical protein